MKVVIVYAEECYINLVSILNQSILYKRINLYYINETSGKEITTHVECTHQLPHHRCLLAIRSFRVSYLKPSDEALLLHHGC
jgi:hypothetical protein